MPPHSPQCKIQMPRRRAAAPPRLVVKKVGKRFGGLPFFYYFCMQITYYLDMKTMNRLRNMAPKGVKVPPGSCVPSVASGLWPSD